MSATIEYLSGFGNEFATEALAGALPVGRNSPQRCALRPLRRAAERHRVHRAARRQPRGRGSTGSGRRRCTRRSSASTPAASSATSATSPTPPNQLRWNPLPHARQRDRLRRGPRDDGRQRRPARAGRRRGPRLRRQPLDDQQRAFYDADGELLIVPQHGRQRFVTELGVDRRRAAGDRRHPARRALSRRAARRRSARLRLRELRRQLPPARPRADRLERAWPTRATS